jgi:hypothetical protein
VSRAGGGLVEDRAIDMIDHSRITTFLALPGPPDHGQNNRIRTYIRVRTVASATVAQELMTQPSLLILDDRTSGPDPPLDRQVMRMLRQLADECPDSLLQFGAGGLEIAEYLLDESGGTVGVGGDQRD